MTLCVHYPSAYPDELPELSLKHDDPNIEEDDEKVLLEDLLKAVCPKAPLCPQKQPNDFYPIGRGERRNGYDIHVGVATPRTTITASAVEDR